MSRHTTLPQHLRKRPYNEADFSDSAKKILYRATLEMTNLGYDHGDGYDAEGNRPRIAHRFYGTITPNPKYTPTSVDLEMMIIHISPVYDCQRLEERKVVLKYSAGETVSLYRLVTTEEQYIYEINNCRYTTWMTVKQFNRAMAKIKAEPPNDNDKPRTRKMALELPSGAVFSVNPDEYRHVIGRGANTTVYAKDSDDLKDFAVKIVNDRPGVPYHHTKVHNEIAIGVIAQTMFPEHVSKTVQLFKRDCKHTDLTDTVVVMERRGMSLAHILVHGDHFFRGMTEREQAVWFAKVLRQVAKMLQAFQAPPHYLHHGDFAPRNLIVTHAENKKADSDPVVSVIDFGASSIYFDVGTKAPLMVMAPQGLKLAPGDLKPSSDLMLFIVSLTTLTSKVQPENGYQMPECIYCLLNLMLQSKDYDLVDIATEYFEADTSDDGKKVTLMNRNFTAGTFFHVNPNALEVIADFVLDPTNEYQLETVTNET